MTRDEVANDAGPGDRGRAPLRLPPKLWPGDRVAVLPPSWAVPAVFPAVHETALRRLRVEIGVQPVELPTTRVLDASPRHRARDLVGAFADPEIKAVMATIRRLNFCACAAREA